MRSRGSGDYLVSRMEEVSTHCDGGKGGKGRLFFRTGHPNRS